MNSKIINPSQYKKTTEEKRQKKTRKASIKIKRGKTNIKEEELSFLNLGDSNKYSKKKRVFVGIISIISMALISVSSATLLSIEKSPIINVFSGVASSNINKDITFNIASLNMDINKNVILNELRLLSYPKILSFDKDYNITYDLANDVTKENDTTYIVRFKKNDINEVVKSEMEGIISNGQNIYNSVMKNISSLEVIDKSSLKIVLSEPNDYFIYYLDFPITNVKNSKGRYTYTLNGQNPVASFTSNEKNILPLVNMLNYTNNLDIVEAFKNGSIHMFVTSNEDDIKMLGRCDYNIKKYRDGETYFLFGNVNSELFKMDEVRKAIAYSIDRNAIAKAISTSFAEVIDVPYIDSGINYKYDIYGANNILVANSWNVKKGVFTKKLDSGKNIELKLNILVNKEDSVRSTIIADSIKQMLEASNIKVNLEKLSEDELKSRVEEENYDMIISKVYIGKAPDISHIEQFIVVNDNVKVALEKVKNSNALTIKDNITSLKETISNEVACIGLVAKNTDVIINKSISGFEDISYMRIFNNIENIGIKN